MHDREHLYLRTDAPVQEFPADTTIDVVDEELWRGWIATG